MSAFILDEQDKSNLAYDCTTLKHNAEPFPQICKRNAKQMQV